MPIFEENEVVGEDGDEVSMIGDLMEEGLSKVEIDIDDITPPIGYKHPFISQPIFSTFLRCC